MAKPSKQLARVIAQTWMCHLAHFRRHRNDEHLEAIYDEARRFAGVQLESDLAPSLYWSSAPLATRAAVLLYLVDRGVVVRNSYQDRVVYEACLGAEAWVACQPELATHIVAALELITALRSHEARRTSRAQ